MTDVELVKANAELAKLNANLVDDKLALLAVVGPDLSGRTFEGLLEAAAQVMRQNGDGPLADCLRDKMYALAALPEHLRGEDSD